MRVIKGENQYAIVVSKDELRYITACVGAAICGKIISRIKEKPEFYGADVLNPVDSNKIFETLKSTIPNKVEGKCY